MCCNDAPDTSGVNAAAKANADIARDALTWYKQQYADAAPLRQQAVDTAQRVTNSQLDAMDNATWMSRDAWRYNTDTYRPLEKSLVNQAENYDTQDRRDQAAGQAVGDVQLAAAAARAEGSRDLERRGVSPNDGAYGAMERATDTGLALGSAAAANRAREQVRTVGHAMEMDAASLGRGLPGQQATQAGIALSAGNSSVGNAQVPVNVAAQGTDQVGKGFQTAISGNNSAGNLYSSAAGIEEKASTDMLSGLGGIGLAAGALGWKPFSNKKMKEHRRPVSGEVALAAVKRMPVDRWRYKRGSPADDGGAEHIGPMAQDVQEAAGDAASDGNRIDLVSMNGINLAATQHLAKRVEALEKKHGNEKQEA